MASASTPTGGEPKFLELRLSKIKVDPDLQSRTEFREDVAEHYADLVREGVELSGPGRSDWPTVFWDGHVYWLARGFHRFRAHEIAERKTMIVRVFDGSRREAILHSIESNLGHGLRATMEDRKRAAMMLLRDPEWGNPRMCTKCRKEAPAKHDSCPGCQAPLWSDREIARRCGLSHPTIGVIRERLATSEDEEEGVEKFTTPPSDWPIIRARVDKAFKAVRKHLDAAGPEGERAAKIIAKAAAAWEEDAAGQDKEAAA